VTVSNPLSPAFDQQPFRSASEHLNAALGWLHRLLSWQIALTRQTYGALADDEFRGLYIPDVEIDLLGAAQPAVPEALAASRAALAHERAVIEERAAHAERQGVDLPLLRVVRLFELTPFERDVLLLALAPELDLRYERLYAYIQDDVTKKRPTVDLALRLLQPAPEERLNARAAFATGAPLLHHRLIQLYDDGQRMPPLLARFVKLDDRIATELIGGRRDGEGLSDSDAGVPRRSSDPPVARGIALDAPLVPFVTITHPTRSFGELVLPAGLADQMRQAVARAGSVILALQGSYGSGRRAIAEALCAEIGIPLLSVALNRLIEPEPASGAPAALSPLEGARRIVREAALRGAAIFWQGADRLLHEEGFGAWRETLLAALDEHAGPSFLAIERPWEARGALRRGHFQRVELPELSFSQRELLWRARLNGDGPDDATFQALASTFRLSGGQIRDAATMARSLARWRGEVVGPRDLYVACRAQSSGRLDSLAHKIITTYAWDDIVLPLDQISQLREICIQVRHRRIVLETWGFDRHLAMGKGVNVLFAGPSGTGKTMAAEIIGADLHLELYKVDLSTMVSKYIGETEKNLDRVFTAAREANAILFFDEADALFGKRSEVKDAHDRYANIEVGYLLQKMEEYDGVVILATNLRKNLDDAFVRRLHVAIDFPFPEEPDRLRIWRKAFPPEAPLAEDVDLAFIARQFKLAGGNIRNIALLSAFLAAEDGTDIGMNHLVRAIKREYQKLGKLVTEAEFGRYLGVARG
jgi:AAA+ superfamily predicted ATPase